MDRLFTFFVSSILVALLSLSLGLVPAYASTTWTNSLGFDITNNEVNCCAPSMSSNGSVMVAVKSGDYVYVSTNSGTSWTKQTSLGTDGWVAGFVSSDGSRVVAISKTSGSQSGSGGTGGLTTDGTNAGGNGGNVTGNFTATNGANGTAGGGGGGGGGYIDGGGGGGGAGGEVIVTEVFSGPSTTTLMYFSNATWTNPGGLDHVIVQVWGGGGGAAGGGGGGGNGGTGAASSFTYESGADTITGNGGHGGTGSNGAGGTASGGTVNTTGNAGSSSHGGNGVTSVVGIAGSGTGGTGGKGGSGGGTIVGGTGPGAGGTAGSNNSNSTSNGSGGSGGYTEMSILAANLGSTETVTVGGGGGGGGGNNSSGAGGNGSSSTGVTGGNGSSGGGGGGGGFDGTGGTGQSPSGNNDIYVSTNSGSSWALATTTYALDWYYLSASSNAMDIVGMNNNNGYLYLSQDGGVNWSPIGTSTVSTYDRTFITPDGSAIFAYSGGNPIFKSTNSGASWTSQSESSYSWANIVPSTSGAILYGTNNDDGYVYSSVNNGSSWTKLTSGPTDYPGLATSGDGKAILTGSSGDDLFLSTDSGSTWTDQTSLGSHSWGFVSISSDGTKLAAAESDDPAIWIATNAISSGTTNSNSSAQGAGLPWCSGPMAPGWNVSLPDGGCGQVAAAAMPGNSMLVTAAPASYQFTRSLHVLMTGSDVMQLQKYLNTHGFPLTSSGPGSSGNETDKFGTLTYQALTKFQDAHAAQILAPVGLTAGTGIFGQSTIQYVNAHP